MEEIMFFTVGVDAFIDELSGIAADSEGEAISGIIRKYRVASGALEQETPYKNGKREGMMRWYYESGAIERDLPYKNGKRDGIERWYYESGAIKKETPYKNGVLGDEVSRLDPFLTIERFVAGDSNMFAYQASRTVAGGNFSLYNPLFIYGGAGLGKTHLMNAVGNQLCESFPKMKVLDDKNFRQVVSIFPLSKGGDLSQEKVVSMQERYLAADLFMMDDFQLFRGQRSREMFFNISNELNKLKKQIIITANKTPQELDIEDTFRSCFTSGFLVGIDPPSLDEKVAILMKKADENNIVIDQDIAFFLSESIKIDDVRRLNGVLKTAYFMASLDNAPISKDYVLRVLKEQKLLKANLRMRKAMNKRGLT
jgi:chromosomal replication initiator protein DnaA